MPSRAPDRAAGENANAGWLLIIETPAATASAPRQGSPNPGRRILGLSVVLRLALTAQAAGATGVVLAGEAGALRSLLQDDRVRLRVVDETDTTAHEELRRRARSAIRVPANLVVHRATFAALRDERRADEVTFPAADSLDASPWASVRGAGGPFGFEPMVVDDETSAKVAERALLRSLRKPQDGWTSTHLNRPISLAITRLLVATPLKPNQVSVGILGIGLLGAFLATRGTYAALAIGAALFHSQSVLDGCDGEMSRITFRGSHLGEWLDTIGDDVTNYGFFAGAAWGLFSTTGRGVYLALGALTVTCGLIGSGLEYRYLIRIGSGDLLKYPLGIGKAPGKEDPGKERSALAKGLDAISPLFKRDTFVLLTLIGAVLGTLGPMLVVFAAGAVGVLVAVIRAELRMMRERRTDEVSDAPSP